MGRPVSHPGQHLVDRYGIDEVSKWYFEVWNEPISISGRETRKSRPTTSFTIPRPSAEKSSIRGSRWGPATAQAAWVDRFIHHVSDNQVPADFVSTHVYGNDPSDGVLAPTNRCPAPSWFAVPRGKCTIKWRRLPRAQSAHHLERVQRYLLERNERYGFRLHGALDGGYDSAMRRT